MVELNETLQEYLRKCSKEDLWEIITKVEHTEVYILDLQAFQFVYCNEIACKNLGYTLKEVQQMSPVELHPHNSPNELHEIANRVESLGSASFSTVSRKKDGTIYPVKVHLQYLVEGSMRFILGTMIDLTQQEKFRAEQWKLISLLQDSTQAVLIADEDLLIDYSNPKADMLLNEGWLEEIKDSRLSDWIHPKGKEDFEQALEAAANQGYWSGELVLRNSSSEKLPVLAEVHCKSDLDLEKGFYALIARDIRHIKSLQSELEEKQTLYSMSQRLGEIGYFKYCVKESAFEISKELLELLGLDQKLLGVEQIRRFLHPEDRAGVMQTISHAIASKSDFDVRARFILANEQERYIRAVGQYLQTPQGEILQGVAKDLTSEVLLEQEKNAWKLQRLHSQKLEIIGKLSRGIAHDFNNLLSVLLGHCEYSRELSREHPAIKEQMEGAIDSILAARDLVSQIQMAGSPAGLKTSTLDLVNLIEKLHGILRSSLPASVELQMFLPDRPVLVHANESQVQQVLMNLVTNSLESLQDGKGTIEIHLSKAEKVSMFVSERFGLTGPCALLTVKDDGKGISDEFVERIFDPYFSTKGGDNSGLGLSVVQGIVHSLGGGIEVNTLEEQGTSFHLYFSFSQQETTPSQQSSVFLDVKGSGHILVVDDEERLSVVIAKMLTQLGYQVSTFNHPVEALQDFSVHANVYDLVVTDFTMPELNGVELIRQMREFREDLPYLLISGYGSNMGDYDLEKEGVRRFLKKPEAIQHLPQVVREILNEEKK